MPTTKLRAGVNNDELRAKLESLPECPGVYLFKDKKNTVIYVGKAKSLKHRVRSYFTAGDDGRYQYPRLVASIEDVEVLLTWNEVDAIKTEQAMINRHRPRYNVDFRDDKSFPYLKITREPYPRVFLTRKPHREDGDYYGPFTDAMMTRWLVRSLKGILQIRNCDLPLKDSKISGGCFKVCLDYHIGRCGGPCEGKVNEESYRRNVRQFLQFLQGNPDKILETLRSEMDKLSANLQFEQAAVVRDRYLAAKRFTGRLARISSRPIDRDAVNYSREDSYAAFSVINIRRGRIVGQSPFHLDRTGELDDSSLLETFLLRHYELVERVPREVLLPLQPVGLPHLIDYFSGKAGYRVRVLLPQRGEKHKLVLLAKSNADHLLAERRLITDKRDFVPRSLQSLQEQLHLSGPPVIIEAFDISNLHGTDSIASMVCFKDGRPFKNGYRIYKIKSVEGIDDFASIGEAVHRRYSRLKTEMEQANGQTGGEDIKTDAVNDRRLPDLVLIDGGKGQLNRAKTVLEELGLADLPVIGLAKRLEEIYIPDMNEPVTLPKTSSALRLLQQVRDEAHRFAVTKHRLLRGKRHIKSRLDEIPGVGPSRKQALLVKFGSLKRIGAASAEEIASTPGVTRKVAERIKQELSRESKAT